MVRGDDSTRLFCRFTEYVSRIGYDDKGRVWPLICPQLGQPLGRLGEANTEVSVTGIRGYVDEAANKPSLSLAADVGVMVQVWFTSTSP